MIALTGGRLCDPGQERDGPADLYLRDGRVAAVLPPGAPAPEGAWERLDCSGLLVMPGPIDTLCRCVLEPDPWGEDPRALAAAAAGAGYTAVLAYTACADPAAIAALGAGGLPARLHPVAALTRGGQLVEFGLLADAGAVAFSDWPAPAGGAAAHAGDADVGTGVLRHALEYAGWLDRPIVVQPADAGLERGGVMHEGERSFALGLAGLPAVAEAIAVRRDAALQRAFGGRLHFAALSSADALTALRRSGAATAGVTARHLAWTDEAVVGYRTAAKLFPPLRGERDREALRAAAEAGHLLLASGHRPARPEEKACEYEYAAFGGEALSETLALAFARLSPPALVRAASLGPARAFGLPGGTLPPGAPADVAVLRPDGRPEWTLVGGRMAFAARDSCIKMQ